MNIRSCHQDVFCKKRVIQKFLKFLGKGQRKDSFFSETASLTVLNCCTFLHLLISKIVLDQTDIKSI